MSRGCWLIVGMLVVAVTMGCAGQKAGMANDPDPKELSLYANSCLVDISDSTTAVERTVEFVVDSEHCMSRSDLVRDLRRNFAACLNRIDSTAIVPSYRNDTELFIAPCLGPEVPTVYQCDRSDSAFTETMIERYINPAADEPNWWFDPCRTDWSPEHCQLSCSTGQVSYYRLDMSQRLFFRFWVRVGGDPVFIEVDGLTKHSKRCRGDYCVTMWGLCTVKTYMFFYDDGSDDAEEESVKPSIQI